MFSLEFAHHLKHHSCSHSSCHVEGCREIEKPCSQCCVHHDEDRSQRRHPTAPPPVCFQVLHWIHAGALQEPRPFSRVITTYSAPVLHISVNCHGSSGCDAVCDASRNPVKLLSTCLDPKGSVVWVRGWEITQVQSKLYVQCCLFHDAEEKPMFPSRHQGQCDGGAIQWLICNEILVEFTDTCTGK